jgi:Metallo-peptidase family M12B Reprolysin-like/Domain of unknown function DUF11
VQITVAAVDIFDTDTDPFTTTDAGDLLDEVAEYRGATATQDALGLTHLFTGRNLDGGTAGIAFIGSLCAQRSLFDSRSFGAGLSEGRRGATLDSLVAAHEIGHNFGAPHDAEAGSACESTPATFLMAPRISGSDQFSACSIAQMQREIESARCLTPIGAANMAASVAAPTLEVAAGVPFDYTFTVANVGVDQATGVHVTVTTANGLELTAANAGGSACTVVLGADCSLGAVDGGTARQVTLNLRASQAGTFALAASVSADSDADPSDDDVGASITATNPVDLVVHGSGSRLEVDQQGTIAAALDNDGDFAATGVGLTLVLTSGLRPDQASATGTTCGVAGQTVTCAPFDVSAHATVAINVTVTAMAIGSQLVSVSATSAQIDTSPSDNEVALAVSVSAPPADDGGTGAVSWLALFGLLGAVSAARRRRIS